MGVAVPGIKEMQYCGNATKGKKMHLKQMGQGKRGCPAEFL
jgi:hypothetical protein